MQHQTSAIRGVQYMMQLVVEPVLRQSLRNYNRFSIIIMVKQVAARKQAVAVEKPALQNSVKLERVAAELEERVRQRYQKDLQKRRLTNPSLATPQWLYELPTVTSASRIVIEKGVDITPDIQREVQTYKLTLDNVNNILDRLKAAKINNERPHDYLAEMYKSDTHMTKIRRHLAEKDAYIKESTPAY